MKKTLVVALFALLALGANAADKKRGCNLKQACFHSSKAKSKLLSIKDQNRSGTCWDYSTLSYFEAEILKKTGKTYDLCESFVANKTYMERAIQVVRLHGDCQFAQGGSAYDVLHTLETHGILSRECYAIPRLTLW